MEEGETAKTTTNRTKLLELLDYCREQKGTIKHVVVFKIDRFSRNQYDHIILDAQLKKFGVTLRSATETISDDSTGRLMRNILGAFSQFDNDVRSERTVAGMRTALEAGQWTFVAPVGYHYKTEPMGTRSIEPDPEMGPLVKKAFELYATGLHSKRQA